MAGGNITTWPIPGEIAGLTPGSLIYVDSAGNPTQDNTNLYWDATAKRLHIGHRDQAQASGVFNTYGDTGATARWNQMGFASVPLHRQFACQGTAAAPTATTSGQQIGGVSGGGYGASAFGADAGMFGIVSDQLWTNTAHAAYLTLSTTPVGSTTLTERGRIQSDGAWVVGTTAGLCHMVSRGAAPAATLQNGATVPTATGTDLAGTVGITLPAVPVAGTVYVRLTFQAAFAAAPKGIVLQPADANSALALPVVTAITTAKFDVSFAAVAGLGGVALAYQYVVIQ